MKVITKLPKFCSTAQLFVLIQLSGMALRSEITPWRQSPRIHVLTTNHRTHTAHSSSLVFHSTVLLRRYNDALVLTQRVRVTHICVRKLTMIGRHQANIWTNAGILLIRITGINFGEILSEIHTFSFKKMHFKTSSGKWKQFYPGFNRLKCT